MQASSTRFDLYGPIHKALRAQLFSTLQAVGSLDVTDAAQLATVCAEVTECVSVMRSHLAHEDKMIHPFMQKRRPGSADLAIAQHDHHLSDFELVGILITRLESSPSEELVKSLYQALCVLASHDLDHMYMEETEHHAILWAECTDDELAQLNGQIISTVAPKELFGLLRWMLPALNPQERANMLIAMQMKMPPEPFEAVLAIARQRLTPQDWAKLERAIAQ